MSEKKKMTVGCDHCHYHSDTNEFRVYKAGETLEDSVEVIASLEKNSQLTQKTKPSEKVK